MDNTGYYFHGTLKDNIESIRVAGITPRIGENLAKNFQGELDAFSHYSTWETRLKVLDAIRGQIAAKWDRPRHTVTTANIEQQGTVFMIDPTWGDVNIKQIPPLNLLADRENPPGVEGGDCISGYHCPPGKILPIVLSPAELALSSTEMSLPDTTIETTFSELRRAIRMSLYRVRYNNPNFYRLHGYRGELFRVDFHGTVMLPEQFQRISFIFREVSSKEDAAPFFLGDSSSWGMKMVFPVIKSAESAVEDFYDCLEEIVSDQYVEQLKHFFILYRNLVSHTNGLKRIPLVG